MTAVATGGESDLPYTFERLIEVAKQYPFLYFESWDCEKCKEPVFMAHQGMERMVCVCGHSRASKTPRPPAPGDLTMTHYQMALEVLHKQAVGRGDVGVASLLKKVNRVAEGLADLDRG